MLIPPRIQASSDDTDEDKTAAYIVNTNLMQLERYVETFASAMTMFEFGMAHDLKAKTTDVFPEELRDIVAGSPSGWKMVAARDGAMSIYHFYVAFEGVRDITARNKALSALVNVKSFKDIGRNFRRQFRDFVDVRDAVAHLAEKTKSPEKHKEHSLSGTFQSGVISIQDSTGVTVDDCLHNRTYQTSWNGKLLSYDVAPETLIRLDSYRKLIWDVFEPSVAET